jgi:hypothetical protein
MHYPKCLLIYSKQDTITSKRITLIPAAFDCSHARPLLRKSTALRIWKRSDVGSGTTGGDVAYRAVAAQHTLSLRCPNPTEATKLKLNLICDRHSVGQSVLVSGAHLGPVTNLEISFRQLSVCYFVAPSLTRGRVCNLLYNCFWALPEQSLLGPSPTEHTNIFYCLIWDSTNLEDQVPVFISPRNRVPQLYPRALGSLLSPLTARRDYGGGILTRLHTGKREILLLYHIQEFSSYLTGNSFRLRYRSNPVTEDQ